MLAGLREPGRLRVLVEQRETPEVYARNATRLGRFVARQRGTARKERRVRESADVCGCFLRQVGVPSTPQQ
jgi:hypothetical protein